MENPFKKLSKPELYAVIGGSALILGYMEYRRHKATGSWNPFSKGINNGSSDTIDTLTGMPVSQDNVTDPVTGMTYLAEAQQYGSVQAAEASVSAYGQSPDTGSGIPVNPASPGSPGTPAPVVSSSVYTSNAAWAQAATAGLASVGYSQTDVAGALGAYLTGTPLTPEQVKLVNTARAEYGVPPSDLPVIPMAAATAAAPGIPSGLHSSGVSRTGFTLTWTPVKSATSYDVRVKQGNSIKYEHVTLATTLKVTGLEPDTTYVGQVAAKSNDGTSAFDSGTVVKTLK